MIRSQAIYSRLVGPGLAILLIMGLTACGGPPKWVEKGSGGYLMRDYAASTTAGDFTRNTEEQNIERAIKTITTTTLSGVRKIDQYMDPKTNTYYVLTKLSLEDMKNNLEQAKELNSQVRDFVRKNADRLFERLENEEEKRGVR